MTFGRLLHDRGSALPADRGPMLTAVEVARDVWQGRVSPKWVLQHMRFANGSTAMNPAVQIAFKSGRSWLWYKAEAEKWRDDYIERQRWRA